MIPALQHLKLERFINFSIKSQPLEIYIQTLPCAIKQQRKKKETCVQILFEY